MSKIYSFIFSIIATITFNANATDTYNHLNNQLSIPAVILGDTVYRDVVITVGEVLTVGGTSSDPKYLAKLSSSPDTYDSVTNQLFIPNVNAYGLTYHDVVVTVDKVLLVGSSEPLVRLPILLQKTSYANAKSQNIPKLNIINPDNYTSAWAAGNFFGDNKMSVMLSKGNSYNCYTATGINPKCLGTAPMYIKDPYRAEFEFYKLAANGNLEPTGIVISGCLTPRKAIVADFNNDTHPDIFVVCHGWDMPINNKWPGEVNKLLLNDSKGSGKFTVSDVGSLDVSYYHGAAAADINNDGWIDIIITDSSRVPGKNITTLINQKDGTFQFDNNRVIGELKAPYYSVELVDVDRDGIVDIIAGGHEMPIGEAVTAILYGNANGTFGTRKTVVPGVPDGPVALDFTVINNSSNQTILYVGRSSYSNIILQSYNITTNISTLVHNQSGKWIEWWLPQTRNNVQGVMPYATKSVDLFYSQ